MTEKQWMACGTLRIKATGFWYTAGGEKGSFGFCPHLKNPKGLPLYPDTMVTGLLRMASEWLCSLGGDFSRGTFKGIFGGAPDKQLRDNAPARLFVGDLTLEGASAESWKPDRFVVKPRIEIDDANRTVRENMLVNHELAWLDGCELVAPLHLGYFGCEQELNTARAMLSEAVLMVGATGAFRSRGYGRGTLSIDWGSVETFSAEPAAIPPEKCHMAFTALSNVRNRPLSAEANQIVECHDRLTPEQLSGWLVSSYHRVYRDWPEIQEVAQVRFSTMYPSSSAEIPAWCPPMTTLRGEDGKVRDVLTGEDNPDQRENFFNTKTKPLSAGQFVTGDLAVVKTELQQRFRNRLGSSFVTGEGSLFVQELLPLGTCLTGTVVFGKPDSLFARRAFHLLSGLKPAVKQALFSTELVPSPPGEEPQSGPFLVATPIKLTPADHLAAEKGNSVILGVDRRYNTTLNRPRRNRMVVSPGSVLQNWSEGAVAWGGFGQELRPPAENENHQGSDKSPRQYRFDSPKGFSPEKLSRSQAGFLRELLHPGFTEEHLRALLEDRLQKFGEKRESEMVALHQALIGHLNQGRDQFKAYTEELVDRLKMHWWHCAHPEVKP